ncbi:SusC/RagA family TonB-linked outer membrane protein [Aquimarina gracilis]|uniref:SusC/RagA family TonB-linked outer membrane protein n=1 Tax=Aquimarina gracilis TaxID=874422 RepID=A0ABU5ZQS2_9FLAO|nr:SusC/RagA family TonB-linked outer membrane protein [Aquimarina gracilis]MEB3344414.1 SusC/RagA family TonB-linked outer membrane protein [Aquimarina gracilis]
MRVQHHQLLIFIFFISNLVFAQQRTISGTVTDNEGIPLPGVNISIKDTNKGTQTDFDGYYTIEASRGETISFSYIGFETRLITVTEATNIDIQLVEDTQTLEEVVVTGVGIATAKRKVAIAVETVSANDLTPAPAADISQALIGKVPGARIQSTSGQPGQQQNILLRGINSLSSSQPMIMVDGVQINTDNLDNGSSTNQSSRLADLDLNDVERIEVIQGAAAGTIYGAQGANGVIQIFTKKGEAGAIKVNFRSRVGFSNALEGNFGKTNFHYFETTSDGFLAGRDGTRLTPNPTTGVWPTPLGSITPDVQVNKPFAEETFDQLDQVFDTAATLETGVSVSGGSEKVRFFSSASHLNQESVIFGRLKRTNFKTNVNMNITDKLTFSSNTTIIGSDNTTGGITGADNVGSALSNALNVPQYIDNTARDAIGNFVGNPTGGNEVNPFYSFENRRFNSDLSRIIQNININYKPFKFLELDYKYGIDHYENKFRELIVNQSLFLTNVIQPSTGSLTERPETGTTQNSLLSAFVRFNTEEDFGWSFPISSSTQISYDWRREDFDRLTVLGTDLPTFTDDINMNQTGQQVSTAFESSFRTFGYLINQKFDFGNYFGVSGGVRVDWSSAFGQGSDAFVFPRGDIYLRVDEFLESDVLNQFKLRAAYGEAGIQPGPFDRIPILLSGQIVNTRALSIPSILQNPDLNVQVSKELEFGSDLVFTPGKKDWFNRIELNATYYTRDSEDIIRELDVPPSQGAASILTNAITIETEGFQAGLNVSVVNKRDFKWNSTFNFGTFQSDITNISNGLDIPLGNNHILREGAPVGAFFGFSPLSSLTQTRSDGTRYIQDADLTNFEIGPNGYVVNRDSKQVVLTDEQELIGDPTPDFTLSFIQEFNIMEHLDFSFQLDWIQGNDIYNQTRQWLYRNLLHEDVSVPVTINGETGAWAAYYANLYATNSPNSEFVEDGSFLRLRNVRLSYDFGHLIKEVSSFRLTVTGDNLLTWTDYKGLDPEAASNFNNPVERGLDQFAFPNFRSFSFGINVGF